MRHWTTQDVETRGTPSKLALFCTSWGQSHSVTTTMPLPSSRLFSSVRTLVLAPARLQTLSQNLVKLSLSLHSRISLSLNGVELPRSQDDTWVIRKMLNYQYVIPLQ